MLATRCCFKKRRELEWVLQYFGDKLTGTDFIERLNDDVSCGNRTGKIRHVDIPYLHSEGSRQRYLRSAAKRRVLSEEQKRQIVIDRGFAGMTLARLAEKYDVSITTIARAVGNRMDRETWHNSK
jgi:Mor family transcriptional regulator